MDKINELNYQQKELIKRECKVNNYLSRFNVKYELLLSVLFGYHYAQHLLNTES